MGDPEKPVVSNAHTFAPMAGYATRSLPKCRVCWQRESHPLHRGVSYCPSDDFIPCMNPPDADGGLCSVCAAEKAAAS